MAPLPAINSRGPAAPAGAGLVRLEAAAFTTVSGRILEDPKGELQKVCGCLSSIHTCIYICGYMYGVEGMKRESSGCCSLVGWVRVGLWLWLRGREVTIMGGGSG